MGWLWPASGPDAKNSEVPAETSSSAAGRTPSATSDKHDEASAPQELDRHQQAFAELKDLLTQVDPERSARASKAVQEKAAAAEAKAKAGEHESFYPSEMSCTQCFDLAYYCSSVGGQLNNVYRFGGLRSCSEQWAKWRFCMRTRAMNEDVRRERIQEWYREQAARYRVGRSSEDVWKARVQPVEGAFAQDVDAFEF